MAKSGKKRAGQLRRSQLLTTYAPGAMVDFPNAAVLMGGLETWPVKQLKPVHEPRLLSKARKLTENPHLELFEPPINDLDDRPEAGVAAYLFPQWFIADHILDDMEFATLRRAMAQRLWVKEEPFGAILQALVHAKGPTDWKARPLVTLATVRNTKMRYKPPFPPKGYKPRPVTPVRFVAACPAGHLEDLNWKWLAHSREQARCEGNPLYMLERGVSGELSDLLLVCACGAHLPLAFVQSEALAASLGQCQGYRPWLGHLHKSDCLTKENKPTPLRLLNRTASNAYFANVQRVIAIPDPDAKLKEVMDAHWPKLQSIDPGSLTLALQLMSDLKKAFEGFDPQRLEAVFAERRGGAMPADAPGLPSVKMAEATAFMNVGTAIEKPLSADDAEFSGQRADIRLPARLVDKIDRVVKVHRMREYSALIGFTRFDPALPDVGGELDLEVKRAPLSEPLNWVPALENKGEGIFLALNAEAVERWLSRDDVKKRSLQLFSGHAAWQEALKSSREYPGLAYVMVHTLSHLLIEAAALSCGYPASAIRERIYVPSNEEDPRIYGILLYTATSDAQGTLGGLVSLADRMSELLQEALELARLCSNDPICAGHDPLDRNEERFLHGAACHGCVLIGETSCEHLNEHLDRALVVPTISLDAPVTAFFE